MSKLWQDLQKLNIPVTQVGMIVAMAITAYIWADDISDAQQETQKQLDQLVVITVKNTKENAEWHKTQGDSLVAMQTALELLLLEIRLRRELEEERDDEVD